MKKTTAIHINKDQFRNYQNIKQKYLDAIVLLRIADNYTAFEKDAEIVQELTGNKMIELQGIGNICSFPFTETDITLHKLVKAGNRVALCDQLDNP